ncbi:RNA polymerase sigma factor [Aquiflexum gelatinilyticum]|uniref:RNA polymerase sigma factor n=1 Tax=Aquiflexum gelatinilyticum TaxID=2961943 RepID=UPI00216A89AC|nr:RNA polymerase sigma factor [Aquiflexum gelatinilyticum]MCS4435837.1 RNA polymerase sigma factor [Aquiflexum gelatinilyticum]
MSKSVSFEKAYQECYPSIRRLCRSYAADPEEAEDLIQETFISAWENWHRFRQESRVSTWIYRIAVNVCLTYIRKARKKPISRLENSPESEVISNPEDGTEEQIQHLYHCIGQLRPADRILITLVLEELPYLEISAITGIKENTIAVRIHRIKKELTEIYQRHERI